MYDMLMKYAEVDDSILQSPLLQAGLLGGLGYFGTNYIYDKIARNKAREAAIAKIADPAAREIERKKYQDELNRKKKMWSAGIGTAMASLPLLANYDTLSRGWKEGTKLGTSHNILDEGIGGMAGLAVAGVGGKQSVDGMSYDNDARSQRVEDLRTSYMDKTESEKSYIYDNLEKLSDSYNDAFFGKDFKLPEMRPLSTTGYKDIPVASSIDIIQSPNNKAIMGEPIADGITRGLYTASNNIGAGLISTRSLIKGLTRAGIGGLAGRAIGGTLGTMFAQPPQVKEKLKTIGAFGGAIANLGIIQ